MHSPVLPIDRKNSMCLFVVDCAQIVFVGNQQGDVQEWIKAWCNRHGNMFYGLIPHEETLIFFLYMTSKENRASMLLPMLLISFLVLCFHP